MENKYVWKVLDVNGSELPKHYSNRYRTEEEASRLVKALNKNGLFGPYKKKLIL